jgi:hypothetical protein
VAGKITRGPTRFQALFVIDLEVDSVDPMGEAHWTATVVRADLAGSGGARTPLPLLDARLTGELTAHAAFVDIQSWPGQDGSPERMRLLTGLRNELGMLSSYLPDGPVGVGARWHSVSVADDGTAWTAEHRLTSWDGDEVRLESTLVGSVPDGKLRLPGLAPDSKLKRMDATGTTVFRLALARLLPEQGTAHRDVAVEVSTGDGTPLEVASGADVTISTAGN